MSASGVTWEQLGTFSFSPDIEKKSLERKVRIERGAVLANRVSITSDEGVGAVGFSADVVHGAPCSLVEGGSARGAGLKIQLPAWSHDVTESRAFAYCAAVVFAMYYKSGGDEAVLALDGNPPVVMMNPFSNAPLQNEPFAEIINDITLKLFTNEVNDASRKKTANALQKLTSESQTRALIGGNALVNRRTFDRLGAEAFLAGFDVVWVVEYLGSKSHQVNIDVVYNAAIFSPHSASNWLQMVKTIVETKNLNSTNIRDLSVIDEEMTNRLLREWQPAILERSQYTKSVAQMFEEAVAEHVKNPTKEIAVIDPANDYSITYAELDEWSTKVAIYLQTELLAEHKARFGVDAVCALHMPRCGYWYVWMLGILKAGGCYLSLDPDFPADRLSYILEDSGAMCLITQSHMVGSLKYDGGPVIAIDQVQDDIVKRIKIPAAVRRAFTVTRRGDGSTAERSAEDLAAVDAAAAAVGGADADADGDDVAPEWKEFVAAATPHTPAYMIYTSGSTGKPKGVCVENINCVSFVLSERELFKLGNYHRIIQGFSTSFDASVEEIWLAFASGSTLIVVQKKIMQDSEALQELIVKHHATVLSTVPTLLATMEPSQLKQLTLVIVGGEACNKEVVEMYATGGHRMFVNSYGPTEATVACCAKFCSPTEPVTIGRAQPNYFAVIIDPESRALLPPGVPGELCMMGPAVTRGYVNRDELTREKFLPCDYFAHTRETHGEDFCRMYRTGDLVRWTVEGNIEFLGRIDSQVKLRGFRIEVSEIENVLAQYKGVTTAVVVLRNDNGMPYLCAYIIGDEELMDNFRESLFREHLKRSLPTYMIPSRFVPIRVLPRSPAGKLDRKGFPEPEPQKPEDDGREGGGDGGAVAKVKPSTPTEFLLMDIWSKHFPGQTLGIDDNFFEIGGHSLLAGKVASEVRRGGFDGFSIRYLYSHPTIRQLAASLDTMRSLTKAEPVSTVLPHREPPSLLKRAFFMLVHLVVMHAVFMILTSYVFFFLWGYSAWNGALRNLVGQYAIVPIEGIALVGSAVMTVFGYTFVLLPLIKWALIWRFREGEYSIWSWFYIRWWAVRTLSNVVPLYFFSGTVFANMYMRVMGASIGRNVTYMPGSAFDFDLITIGADSAIGHETLLAAHEVVDSVLVLRPIQIGRSCSVGARCCVKGGAVMEDEAMLQHLSLLTENHRCGPTEIWGGSPATKIGVAPYLHEIDPSSAARPSAFSGAGSINEEASLLSYSMRRAVRLGAFMEALVALLHFLFFVIVQTLCISPIMSMFLLVWRLVQDLAVKQYYIVALGAIGAAPFAIAVIFLWIHIVLVALRWIVLPWKVVPGNYSCRTLMFHRKIFFDLLMRVSLFVAHPLYASIYTQYLLRALGCDVGRRVECSNLFGFTPGLIKFGNETFVADFVGVNPPTIYRGVMMLGFAEIEDRSFVGNGAVLPSKVKLHQRSLLGLLSHPARDLEAGSTYIGSPAFSIPRQAQNDDSRDVSATYRPTTSLVVQRCLWEFFRTVTPAACLAISLVGSFIVVSFLVADMFSLRSFAIVMNLFVWVNIVIVAVMILVIKWVVVGREHSAQYPLWSTGVWRAEFVVDCTTVLGTATFLASLRGTPLIAPFFRLLGAKIGSNCYIDTLFFTEPDMVTIGDNCCIGDRVTIQTHLFEDRMMKVEPLTIGDRVSVGPLSIVLYNTTISRGATIGALSLVMKGEAYPPGTHWEGVPAQRRGIPACMAVAPPSMPKFALQPPTLQPPSSKKKAAVPKPGTDEPLEIGVDVEAVRDALCEWLLDDGVDA